MKVLEQLRHVDDAKFLQMYTDLSQQGFGPLDGEVAKALKFRPMAIRKLPMDKRARKARQLMESNANAELCYEFLGSWLLRTRKELVTSFLDATGVKHEDGMLHDLDHNKPDPAKLEAAVAELDKSFEPADVTMYLALCAEQWPGVPELDALWMGRV